jgi:transposase-like protein
MTGLAVPCPPCHRAQVVTRGPTGRGIQRSLCQHTACVTGRVCLAYRHRGGVPEVKHHGIDRNVGCRRARYGWAKNPDLLPTAIP